MQYNLSLVHFVLRMIVMIFGTAYIFGLVLSFDYDVVLRTTLIIKVALIRALIARNMQL